MDPIHIIGGKPLQGEVTVQGSKNASLPILAACILIPGTSIVENCPDIADVQCMKKLLESIGCKVTRENDCMIVDAGTITDYRLPERYVTQMRSSVILMGALLGRMKNACLDYPGGCVIGDRPIDYHLEGFTKLGVTVTEQDGSVCGNAVHMKGNRIFLPFPSVGATENLILASVMAEGTTILMNYAKEPEIKALCDFLIMAGAGISGYGTAELCIYGGNPLKPVCFRVPSDRIVAGTYLLGCQAAGGSVVLRDAPADALQYLISMLRSMGSTVETEDNLIRMSRHGLSRGIPYIKTEVYPGFPTDLQSQLIVALSLAEGTSIVEETIFEGRFRISEELSKMGADIRIEGKKAVVSGIRKLYGAQVMAHELRGGAALVLAGLCAKGRTEVSNRHYIDRGYVDICGDLSFLGAQISG